MSQSPYRPDYAGSHALLIGVDAYRHFPPLKTAVKGVQALADVFHAELGFPRENLSILENDEATQRNIRRKLVEPLSRAEVVGPDDRVIVYFAGHGVTVNTASGPQGYIVPVDGEPEYYDTLIAMDELTRTAAEHIHAKHVIFLLDACFSGFATVRMSETSERQYRDYMTHPVRQVIAAGTRDQAVSDLWGPGGHSLFTGFLLDGLRGNAPAPGGMLRGFHLAGWLQDQVAQHSRSLQTPQYAALMGSGGGDFIFTVREEIAQPEQLPDEILALLESPLADARRAGAETLAHLLTGSQPAVAELARERLTHLAQEDDSLSVRRAAQQALGRVLQVVPEPEPPSAPAPQRVEAAMPEAAVAEPANFAEEIAAPAEPVHPASAPPASAGSTGWYKAHSRAFWASVGVLAVAFVMVIWFERLLQYRVLYPLFGGYSSMPVIFSQTVTGLSISLTFGLILKRRRWALVWPLIVWPAAYLLIAILPFLWSIGLPLLIILTLIFIWVTDSQVEKPSLEGQASSPSAEADRPMRLRASLGVLAAGFVFWLGGWLYSEGTFGLGATWPSYRSQVVPAMFVFGGIVGLATSLIFNHLLKRHIRDSVWLLVIWTVGYSVVIGLYASASQTTPMYSPNWVTVGVPLLTIVTLIYVWASDVALSRDAP